MLKNILKTFSLSLPLAVFALGPTLCVENQTDMSFFTLIGESKGVIIKAGKTINVPYNALYARCHNSSQPSQCLMNLMNADNNDHVASILMNPKQRTLYSEPEFTSAYQNINIEGYEIGQEVRRITLSLG